jgi:hypothetical protein
MIHFLVGRHQARLASEVGTIVKPHGGKSALRRKH